MEQKLPWILMDSIVFVKNSNFDYIEKPHGDKNETIKSCTIDSYPVDLKKKVTLLQHFRSYFLGENEPPSLQRTIRHKSPHQIYLKKWMTTHHATIFRLSNKVIQVNFKDDTEILLCSEDKEVIYRGKKGEKLKYSLNTALESDNKEMTKRLSYTKDLLTKMLNSAINKGERKNYS